MAFIKRFPNEWVFRFTAPYLNFAALGPWPPVYEKIMERGGITVGLEIRWRIKRFRTRGLEERNFNVKFT